MASRVSKLGCTTFASIDDEADGLIFNVRSKTWDEWLAEGHRLWITEPPMALDGVFHFPTHFGPTDVLATLFQGTQAFLIHNHAQRHFVSEDLGNSNIRISKDTGKAYAICSKHIGEDSSPEAMEQALNADIKRLQKFVMSLLEHYPDFQSTIEYTIFKELHTSVILDYQRNFDTLRKFEIIVFGSPLLWTDEDRSILIKFFYFCDKNISVFGTTLKERVVSLTSLGIWFERVPRPRHEMPPTREMVEFDFDVNCYPLFNRFTHHGYDSYVKGKDIISYMRNITQHLQISTMDLESTEVAEQYIKSILPEALPKIFFAAMTFHKKEKLGSELLEDALINLIKRNIQRYEF